jgi:transient receptor potential cation channel subfamily M protein 8
VNFKDAWVTTGGTNNGCMKLVGEAFRLNSLSVDPDKLVPLLGIANWCTVENHEFLKNKLGEEIEYELVKKTDSKKRKAALLDPNHSHFVLVDNAFYLFGSEIDFRTELEAEIAHFYQIPIVVLVVGGGWRTVNTILESLKKKTPCVILESSGECANVLTYAINRWDKYQEKSRKETEVLSENELILKYTEDLKKEIEESHPNQKKDIVDLVIKFIFEILKPENRKYLTVCKPINDKAEIDVAILNARIELNQSKQDKTMQPIDMALNWNRIDIARSNNLLESVKDDNNKLNDLMYQAILNDRVEFVKMFIENNFPFKNFASWKILLRLYKNVRTISRLLYY